MKPRNVEDVADVYALSRRAVTHDAPVSYPQLRDFVGALKELRRGTQGQAMSSGDPLLSAILKATGIMWSLSQVPLPAADPSFGLENLANDLSDSRLLIQNIYDLASESVLVEGCARALVASNLNPLGDKILEVLAGVRGSSTGIFLKYRKHVGMAEDWLKKQVPSHAGPIRLLPGERLRDPDIYDLIITVGPSHWFPGAISAPRSPRTAIVRIDFQRDRSESRGLFSLGSPARPPSVHLLTGEAGEVDESHRSEGGVAADDYEVDLPEIDWDALDRVGQASSLGDPADEVAAKLLRLATGLIAYIEAEPGSENWILDPDSGEDDRVRLEAWDTLKPGMYLVLREGGGSSVEPIADLILGANAALFRANQNKWKEALRIRIIETSADAVALSLSTAGVSTSADNIRSWASHRVLAPAREQVFVALLKLLLPDEDPSARWREVRLIRVAQKRAGQRLRQLLIAEAKGLNLALLTRTGEHFIEHPDLDAAPLRLLRIEAVSPSRFRIAQGKTDHPFKDPYS